MSICGGGFSTTLGRRPFKSTDLVGHVFLSMILGSQICRHSVPMLVMLHSPFVLNKFVNIFRILKVEGLKDVLPFLYHRISKKTPCPKRHTAETHIKCMPGDWWNLMEGQRTRRPHSFGQFSSHGFTGRCHCWRVSFALWLRRCQWFLAGGIFFEEPRT